MSTSTQKIRMPHLGWSSHVYPLEAADVLAQPDYTGAPIPSAALPNDEVILYIRPNEPDVLLRGRALVAACAPQDTVPVRVVFKPSVAKWNLFGTLIRVFRNRYRYHGTGRYHISVCAIRALGLERVIRSVDNPQKRGGIDRQAAIQRLLTSLRTKGYDDNQPLHIMLCRTGGTRDSLRQGHHRVSACLACGIDRASVFFSAAGALPLFLRNMKERGAK